jgi:hypothetical protein
MKAIVTLVVGARYEQRFKHYCYPNWSNYAARHGLDLVVFDHPIDNSVRARARSISWQKCLAVIHPKVQKYDQVVWIDSDIVINDKRAPSIFEFFKLEEIGAVKDFDYPTKEAFRAALERLYDGWDKAGIRYTRNLTPEEFYMRFGLPPLPDVVHCGVIGLSPSAHASVFQTTYDKYEDKGGAQLNYEMRPLSYEILTNIPVKWLDHRFNLATSYDLSINYPHLADQSPTFVDRLKGKLGLTTAQQRRIRPALLEMLERAFFLHFAGCQRDMELL